MFAIISYSSLAAVLLTATLTSTGVISFPVALCLVIGANLGSGILAMINNSAANASARRVALGSLLFKLVGNLIILPFVHVLADAMHRMPLPESELVIYFHVFYNLIRCVAMVPFAEAMARLCKRMIHEDPEQDLHLKPKHLDTTALDTPALALANAARETCALATRWSRCSRGCTGDAWRAAGEKRAAQAGGRYQRALHRDQALSGPHAERRAGRRRVPPLGGEIIEMALNLEQASDIVERMGSEIADKSLAARRRRFSVEGLKELDGLYEQLLGNLQLAMSVFFSSDVPSARRLRRNKHRFRILNRRYSHAHVDRLHQQNVQSIETSSLHLGLLGDMKRLNSLFCSVAYSVMEQPDEDDDRDEYWSFPPSAD